MQAKTKFPRRYVQQWRPTDDDQRVMRQLQNKLGVGASQIFRLAIRKLAEAEGLTRKSA